eukprot:Hpha_TRINITY_DN7125_c0_g1::TRINITY_DN7125_c0_g1_i1::g.29767::m.29767
MEDAVRVRLLCGKELLLQGLPKRTTLGIVRARVAELVALTPDSLSFAWQGRCLKDDLTDLDVSTGVVLHCALRLRGGKGGFGSQLRARGKAASQKTTNFDACRDLNGNRIRHVRQQEALEAWAKGDEDADLKSTQKYGAALTSGELKRMQRKREEDLKDAQSGRAKAAAKETAEEREKIVQQGWAKEQASLRATVRETQAALQAMGAPKEEAASDTSADARASAPPPPAKRPRLASRVFGGGVALSDTSADEKRVE